MNTTRKLAAVNLNDAPFQLSIPTPSASALLTSSKILSTYKVQAFQRFLDAIPVSPCCTSKAPRSPIDVVATLQNSRHANTDRSKRLEGGTKPDAQYVRTCAEADAAAQREIDEDDYAWYYRNPQRYNRRPRNSRLRMQRRKKIVCGVATGEEGAATNRTLFAAYLARYYPSIRVTSSVAKEEGKHKQSEVLADDCGTEDTEDSWKMVSGGGVQISEELTKMLHGTQSIVEISSVDSTMEDWQEDLFSPNEAYANRFNSRSRSFSISSSIQSYSSTYSYYDSAASSVRLSYESPPIEVKIEAGRLGSFIDTCNCDIPNKLLTSPLSNPSATVVRRHLSLPFLRLYS